MNKKTNQSIFNRRHFLNFIEENSKNWDIIVIGGGATGLGAALDASSRGFRTLLLEQADFANGTSSRSTKLAHGGVRYLAQGNISLVNEALHERGLMLKNAPHIVHMLSFIIPGYAWWQKYFYGFGLKIYDWMARRLRLHKTHLLSEKKLKNLMPNLKSKGLTGGVHYFDGQFDDARLAINIAQTCAEQGGALLNYMKVTNLLKNENGIISGVCAKDMESGQKFDLKSKVVVNATGVFVDDVLDMNSVTKKPLVKVSQGVHIVLDKHFLKGETALMIPSTSDGRVLFAIPWHDHLLVGTTDTPVDKHILEPIALKSEITFILETLNEYLDKKPTSKDILSVFAGLRPLVVPTKEKGTKEISRDHKLLVSDSNLITITGGKWTTYRKMAEDTINEAIKIGELAKKDCITTSLKIHGYTNNQNHNDYLNIYGSDAKKIIELASENSEWNQKLHPDFPNIQAEVVWAVRNEMARTVEDVLARRLRILFLDAKIAIELATKVAEIMAKELKLDDGWQKNQVNNFTLLAQNYLTEPYLKDNSLTQEVKI